MLESRDPVVLCIEVQRSPDRKPMSPRVNAGGILVDRQRLEVSRNTRFRSSIHSAETLARPNAVQSWRRERGPVITGRGRFMRRRKPTQSTARDSS